MHADPLDMATHYNEQATEDAIERQRRLAAPEQLQNADGSWPHTECVACGDDIEPARIAHGKVRCFACQSALERRRLRHER